MVKKKKTKETEYAVKYLHDTIKMSATDIALELGLEKAVVDGIINTPKEEKPRKVSKSQNLMVRHTASKKTNNVSVMTESASQLNDELSKKFPNTKSRTSRGSIFKPNG
jgi:phenolic acid decarboxylase